LAEDTSVQKLDAALDNYQQPKEPVVDTNNRLADMEEYVANQKAEKEHGNQKDAYKKEMTSIIADCREDTEILQSDLVIRGVVNALAEDNDTFAQAYINRVKDPEAYQKTREWAITKAREELTSNSKVQKVVQASLAAAGHSEDEPPKPERGKTDQEIKDMSAADFQAWKRAHR